MRRARRTILGGALAALVAAGAPLPARSWPAPRGAGHDSCAAMGHRGDAASRIQRPDPARAAGRRIPDVWLLDEHGDTLRTGDFAGRVLVVQPFFASCRHVCPAISSSLVDALTAAGGVGRTIEVLLLSFDAADTPGDLREYRRRAGVPEAWRLACGPPDHVRAVLEAMDYRTLSLPGGGFAHPTAVAVLSPDLEPKAFLYGMVYDVDEVKRALRTAAGTTSLVRRYRGVILGAGAAGLVLTVVVAVVAARGRWRRSA